MGGVLGAIGLNFAGKLVNSLSSGFASKAVDGLLGNNPNKESERLMDKQNAFNAQQAQLNRDFQLQMYNRANEYNSPKAQMQRYLDAGLNPDLMYGGGANAIAAQAPQGSQASAGYTAQVLDNQMRAAQINKTNAETDLIKSQGRKTDADTQTIMTYNKWQEQILSGQVEMNNVNIRLGASNIDVNEATSRKLYAEAIKLDAETGEVYARIDKLGAELRTLDADTALKKLEYIFQSKTFNDRVEQLAANLKKTYSDIALNGAQIKNLLESLVIQRCQLSINQQNADTNRLNAYTAMSAQESQESLNNANIHHLQVVDGKLQFDLEVDQGKHSQTRAGKIADQQLMQMYADYMASFVHMIPVIGALTGE